MMLITYLISVLSLVFPIGSCSGFKLLGGAIVKGKHYCMLCSVRLDIHWICNLCYIVGQFRFSFNIINSSFTFTLVGRFHSSCLFAWFAFVPDDKGIGTTVASPTPSGDYGIALDELVTLTRENNVTALQQYGGVRQLKMCFSLFL